MSWESLPFHLLESIFLLLDITDCYQCCLVCSSWGEIFEYDYIWKKLFNLHYNVSPSTPLKPNTTSWLEEYKRLRYRCPTQCSQILSEHTDEVLHCTWAPDGRYIATSSKDKFVIIWSVENSSLQQYDTVPRQDSWQYCQKCIFNKTSTLLLVSGTLQLDNRGEIIIYHIKDRGLLPHIRVLNMPYDVFGCWVTPDSFIVGERDEVENAARFIVYSGLYNVVPTSITVHLSRYTLFIDNIRTLCVGDVDHIQNGRRYNKALLFSRSEEALVAHQIVVKYMNYGSEIQCDGSMSRHSAISDQREEEAISSEDMSRVDHVIDLKASIIGLAVGEDKVYVNCRKWTVPDRGRAPGGRFEPYFPEISKQIELRIYTLHGLQHLITMSTATAHTGADCFFFIHLNLTPSYIVSGDEGHQVHIFDRYYCIPLAQLSEHSNVVNAAAINPVRENEMVSVSDDGKVCYWVSREISSNRAIGPLKQRFTNL